MSESFLKMKVKSLLLICIFAGNALAAAGIDLSNAKVIVLNPRKTIHNKAADMLRDEIEKRTRIGLEVLSQLPAANNPVILIGTAGDLARSSFKTPRGLNVPQKADAYALWVDTSTRNAATVCAAGYDERGTLYAVGRLLRVLDMGPDELKLDVDTAIATAPKYPLRGHQFAYRPKTNSYDGWTIEMWEQYCRDMIVFGMNAVELIPPKSDDASDSPHFPRPQIEMMTAMSQLAADYGLDLWIWFPAIDRDYSDPRNVELAMQDCAEVFRRLPRVDAVFVPGGDPGSTHPKYLMPFIEKEKRVLNKYHPNAQIWVSPQNFDRKGRGRDGWYKAFIDILQNDRPNWLDGVVFGPAVPVSLPRLRRDVPPRYPIRRYPDITHTRSCPYQVQDWDRCWNETLGREPINPRPVAYAQIFRALAPYAVGFITYSEGCNDDFNKVLWSCLGWDPDMKVEDITRQYSRYFIGRQYEHKFAKGLLALEKNWVGPALSNQQVYQTLELFQDMERNAAPQQLLNWRFQQGLYRAYYDAYIKARLDYEITLEKQAIQVLKEADRIGSLNAVNKARAVIEQAQTRKPRPDLRQRVFELAEALFQSIRMQLSVEKYHSQRYGNLDDIDEQITDCEDMAEDLKKLSTLGSEQQRVAGIAEIVTDYAQHLADYEKKSPPADWPNWRIEFDNYQRKRFDVWKPTPADWPGP